MKNRICLTLLALILSFSLSAQEGAMKDANNLYQSGQYQKAIEAYESIINTNQEAPELYYNLGNAYYKTGDVPSAILNYERALLLSPGDRDIKYNLEMSRKMVVDKLEAIPQFFLNRWINSIIMTMSSNAWAWFSIVTFILVLLFALFFFFSISTSLKKLSFSLSIIFLFMSVTTFSFSYSQKQKLENRNQAIIFAPSVTIKGSPDDSGTDLFLLHEGTKVKVLETLGEWANIQVSDGNEGWITQSAIRII